MYEELYEGREQWKNIGLKLGLNMTMLNIIEKDRQYKRKPCCLDMLKKWLTNGTNRSWSALADAMESPIVNLSSIAAALRKKYCSYFVDFEDPMYSLEKETVLVSAHEPDFQRPLNDFITYLKQVEFIISVLDEKEYRAAICNMQNPIGEEVQEMKVTLLNDDNINMVVGSFANSPIVIVKSADAIKLRNDLEAALVFCSNAKYILCIGTGYAFQKKDVQLGDVFISSSISLIEQYDVTQLGDSANIYIQDAKSVDISDLLKRIFCSNINSVEDFYLSEKRIARYHCSNIVSGIDFGDANFQNADKITVHSPAIGGDYSLNEIFQLQKCGKISGFIVIKSVTKYADGSCYNNWDFTGAMAAFHFTKEKMIPYIRKCQCHNILVAYY